MTDLKEMKGIGEKSLLLLKKLEIASEEDLLEYYPFRYNWIKRSNLNALTDESIIIDGVVASAPKIFYIHKNLSKISFPFQTETHILNIVIFNRSYLKQSIKVGSALTIFGKIDKHIKTVVASEIRFGSILKESIEPVYHTTSGISSIKIAQFIDQALKKDFYPMDFIPKEYVEKYHLMSKKESILEIHHPTSRQHLKQALSRAKYEELFLFMMKMTELKENKTMKIGLKRTIDFTKVEEVMQTLPFSLTVDQRKSIEEIYKDLSSEKRMNRLLQGDVGSGKTIVALLSMYMNYLSGYQSCLMAPTEILARQHYDTILHLLSSFGVKVALLTGKLKAKERREILEKIASKEVDIIVGTHALFTDDVIYNNLGLVITDEQHRFGVNQRGNLKNKGITPDVLYMSATPIPRTYALTIYGDMDISSIASPPSGRKEIITLLKKEKDLKEVLTRMLEELKKKHQVYVIAPLVEESDKIDLENVYTLEKKMNRAFGKYYKVGVLHGKMKAVEKEAIMDSFQEGSIDILISTTVIEVGINVANATMMVIFDSYRFGLSALHQLRGRVGRSDLQSYCILISDYETERLSVLTKTTDGFKISEEDFRLRGSGDLFGSRQSGNQVFKLANFKEDFSILKHAKEDASAYYKSEEFKNNFVLQELLKKSEDLD